ncbi:MAG: mechanosensitive ion channel family protein [Jiangellales bacterium]
MAGPTSLLSPTSADATPEPTDVVEPIELDGDITDASWWLDLATGPLLRTAIILLTALVVRYAFTKVVDGFVARLSNPKEVDPGGTGIASTAREVIGTDRIDYERRATRSRTLGQLFMNVGSVVILTIAALMVLAEWGFNLAPLIAGAGVLGVALGFGAQTLVADFLSGVFMLMEDQYGVGDIVDLGEASGTVEDVQLRVTKLRAVDGVVWWVRNGEVVRVGNMSQNWSRAVVDVGVAYDSDLARVRDVLSDVAHELHDDEEWTDTLLETPEVWGVEDLAADAVTVRVVLKTVPGQQWAVARELRQRVHSRLKAEGIEIPFPQRTVWVRNEA